MRASCWVCGWVETANNRLHAGALLREHEATAAHPRAWCPECERSVSTHEGRFPEHYRPLKSKRLKLWDWSGQPVPDPGIACVVCGHGATLHAVDDEERRECVACECSQFDMGAR